MQFQVPQFIETEDKIVGPFSLRQFAYMGVAAVLSAMLYFTIVTWLWAILSVVIFGLAISLAFVKIEGRSFLNVIFSAFNFYWKPQTYVWQPEHQAVVPHPSSVQAEAGTSGLKEILSTATAKTKRENVATGAALHQSWAEVQTGAPFKKESDRQFLEGKMMERYQVFRRNTGERNAAKRVDYR